MKKITALVLALMLVFALASCGSSAADISMSSEQYANAKIKSEGVMSYAEYAALPLDAPVVIEAYVQATQSWWDNKITVYAADLDGAYFLYEMACTEENAKKLTPGTKIKVTGFKGAWAGEVEVMNATFEFVGEEGDSYIAPALDVTAIAGKASLLRYQNQLVTFKGMEVVSVEYKNGERGDDVYLTAKLGETSVSFCVEMYLTDPESDVYKAVEALKSGDKIDIEAFLYWYNGANPHVVGVTKK